MQGHHVNHLQSVIAERPKIWLPRNLRQTLIKKVGETINLVIPFQVRKCHPKDWVWNVHIPNKIMLQNMWLIHSNNLDSHEKIQQSSVLLYPAVLFVAIWNHWLSSFDADFDLQQFPSARASVFG